MELVPASIHTKKWRQDQSWYFTGKKNECELQQWEWVRQIIGYMPSLQTNMRIHLETKELLYKLQPLTDIDGFEYTEDFDGHLSMDDCHYYFNLKFVCGTGGSQTRTLRESYHFVKAQLDHLVRFPDPTKYCINIFDGDGAFKCLPKFDYLLTKTEYKDVAPRVFVGDTCQFQSFWQPMKINKKQRLGQFYTTRYDYILQGLSVPKHVVHVVEPFAGAGHLLGFIPTRCHVECYDIDPKHDHIIKRDTLLDPPSFHGKFVATNPPYLARNKCADKTLFEKYNTNDLYKCFLRELINNPALGGVLIVPLNFWCSMRKSDVCLRQDFLEHYEIIRLNIFEEPVFQDTDYSVCSFQFTAKTTTIDTHPILVSVFPHGKKNEPIVLHKEHGCMIGGEIYNLPRTHQYVITRRTRLNTDKPHTNLVIKCIDDDKPISMAVVPCHEIYTDNTPHLTSRSYATLVIDPPIGQEQQQTLANTFNRFLEKYRQQYNSLFLPAYREHRRKRLPFDLAYHITGHLLETTTLLQESR